ncbi:MAG: acyltransferase [Sphingomonadaceae bacterium]
MRLLLAVAVILWHSVAIAHGPALAREIVSGPFRPVIAIVLPMFFALSGFLVAGSLLRCRSLLSFLGLRAIRIFPALTVEVVLSAFLIGPLLTAVPLTVYFTSAEFYNYLWNIIGHIHYFLPGVFEQNPVSRVVNGQLWTVPYELKSYIVLAILGMLGAIRYPSVILVAILAFISVDAWSTLGASEMIEFKPTIGAVSGTALVISFLAGVAAYLYRDSLPWNHRWGVSSGIVSLFLLVVPLGDLIAPLTITYFTVWLGLTNFRKLKLLQGADYSYGLFLYGFVIQQMVYHLLPWSHEWYLNFLVAMPLACVFAAFSWHGVEKPALGLRRQLMSLEQIFLRASPQEHKFLPLRFAFAMLPFQRQ